MSGREGDWYFDVISPFAYLQWKTRSRFGERLRLTPVPVVLGALLGHWEQKGPAEIAPKRLHTYRACQWRADRLGVPFRFPPAHPFNPISALRLIVALGATPAVVDALFDAAFRDGLDVSEPDILETIGNSLGLEDVAGAIAQPHVKNQLRANTDRAIEHGVFGVPTIAVGDDLFWGEDSPEMLIDFLDNPALFTTGEMARLGSLPTGVTRSQKRG